MLLAELSRIGAKVVLLCRSIERAEKAAQDIRLQTEGEVIVEQLDLGKPKLKKKNSF
jgi:short-subunit dehydrogenase